MNSPATLAAAFARSLVVGDCTSRESAFLLLAIEEKLAFAGRFVSAGSQDISFHLKPKN